jgi:hypothetical protein
MEIYKRYFIFSFANRSNLQSAKVGYSNGDGCSVFSRSDYGPLFGGGHDLAFYNKWYKTKSSSYPDVGIPNNFDVDDYEIFQVIKK